MTKTYTISLGYLQYILQVLCISIGYTWYISIIYTYTKYIFSIWPVTEKSCHQLLNAFPKQRTTTKCFPHPEMQKIMQRQQRLLNDQSFDESAMIQFGEIAEAMVQLFSCLDYGRSCSVKPPNGSSGLNIFLMALV